MTDTTKSPPGTSQIGEHVNWYLNNFAKHGLGFAEDWTEIRNFGAIQLQHIDLSNHVLTKADFRSANLRHANFENADLRNVDFRWANLRNANFTGAILEGARFCKTDLRDTTLVGEHVDSMYQYISIHKSLKGFKNWLSQQQGDVDISSGLDLKAAWIQDLVSDNTDLSDSNFAFATINNSSFKNSNLTNIELSQTYVNKSNLAHSLLNGARIDNSDVIGCDFTSSILVGAAFTKSRVKHTDFTSSNLAQAKLTNCNFIQCIFRASNIIHTIFSDVNFNHSDFRGVELYYGYRDEDDLNQIDYCDFNKSKLFNTNWEGEDLSWSRMIGVDLSGANLKNTNLTNVDLSDSNLENADLTGADFRNVNGALLNNTRIKNAIFNAGAKDPWSILRTTYTGPNFLLYILLTVVFFIPFVAKIIFWRAINSYQAASADVNLLLCGEIQCDQSRILYVLLGLDQGWIAIATISVLVYNLLRAYLTIHVSKLRDAEERSGYSPVWRNLNSTTLSLRYSAPIIAGVNRLSPPKNRATKYLRIIDIKINTIYSNVITRFKHFKENSLILDPGYQKLLTIHRICKFLFWISIAMFVWNLSRWLFLPIHLPT